MFAKQKTFRRVIVVVVIYNLTYDITMQTKNFLSSLRLYALFVIIQPEEDIWDKGHLTKIYSPQHFDKWMRRLNPLSFLCTVNIKLVPGVISLA